MTASWMTGISWQSCRCLWSVMTASWMTGMCWQGYGMLVLEQYKVQGDGTLLTRGPGNYKIPTVGNIPQSFNVTLLRESGNTKAVYSSKVSFSSDHNCFARFPFCVLFCVYFQDFQLTQTTTQIYKQAGLSTTSWAQTSEWWICLTLFLSCKFNISCLAGWIRFVSIKWAHGRQSPRPHFSHYCW